MTTVATIVVWGAACRLWVLLVVPLFLYLPGDDAARTIPAEKVVALQRALKTTMLLAMPDPMVQGKDKWGHQERTVSGLKWSGKPELRYEDRNHGTWRKYEVQLRSPHDQHLRLRLEDVKITGSNQMSFVVYLEADVTFEVTQENWNHGMRLFHGTVRGQAVLQIKLLCTSHLEMDTDTKGLPALKYRLKTERARASYDELKIKHVAGLGGSAAKWIGDWSVDAMNQLKPSIERKLIDKLSAKLVKAADTKEIQISLSGIERKK